jgi:hypothetical protein
MLEIRILKALKEHGNKHNICWPASSKSRRGGG